MSRKTACTQTRQKISQTCLPDFRCDEMLMGVFSEALDERRENRKSRKISG